MIKPFFLSLLCILLIAPAVLMAADRKSGSAESTGGPLTIIKDGVAQAEIVVDSKRPRMATLAALELQHFLEKMSGARLPIVTTPTSDTSVKIHVGKSPGTDKLGIIGEDLRYGAFRIVSGSDWLVLVGNDKDFVPPDPFPSSNSNIPATVARWDELTKGKTDVGWGYPFTLGYKNFWNGKRNFNAILTAHCGDGAVELWQSGGSGPGFWEYDEGGSFNAVVALLGKLGVRWYMPGESNVVVPEMATVTIEPINETVKPAYALRSWMWYNYGAFSFDDVIWARRVGMDSGDDKIGLARGPHGLVGVHSHQKMKDAHPEYYALINGKRDIIHLGSGTPNFMSEGLIQETVNYIRYLFDTYDVPLVDIWPVDGLQLSKDDASKGKTASELVWGFADRVAREVYKTHSDKLVICGAYTTYIDFGKLEIH